MLAARTAVRLHHINWEDAHVAKTKAAPAKAPAKKKPAATIVGKAELIADIAEKTKSSKKEATEALNVVLETIQEHLAKGNGVRLIPFGSFEVRERKGRTGRNPRTGIEITIEPRKVPAFKPGKALRDSVQ